MIRAHKEKILVTIFKIIGALSFIISGIYISNHVGPEGFGFFSVFFSTVIFLTMFGKAGLDLYLLRYGTQFVNKTIFPSLLRNVLLRFVLVQLLCSILLFIILNELKGVSDVYMVLYENYILISISGFLIGFSDVFSELWRVNNRLASYAFHKFTIVPFFTLVLLPFFYSLGIGIYGFEAVVVSASIYFLLTLNASGLLSGSEQVAEKYTMDILKLSFPMMIIGGLMFVMSYIDTYIISYVMDAKYNGYFAAIMRIAAAVTFITSIVITLRAKSIVDMHLMGGKLSEHFHRTVYAILILGIPVTIIIILFSDFILSLYGDDYKEYTTELIVYVIAVIIGSIPLGYYFVLSDRQLIFSLIIGFAVILNAILNIIFIPVYGLMAAVISTLISNLTWNVIAYGLLRYRRVI